MKRPAAGPARVFVALWPTPPVRERLAEEGRRLHKHLGGRLTRPETVHMTLVFIGDLPRDRLPDLRAALVGTVPPAFELVFDTAECWRHNRIACLGASNPPAVLFDLVKSLESQVRALGVAFDRRPYRPHVTLLRKAQCKNPTLGRVLRWGTDSDVVWPVTEFTLVESALTSPSSRYAVLARFPLAGAAS